MFVNFTNHPSTHWSQEQLAASSPYGAIIDIPFPQIDPMASTEEIVSEARKYTALILKRKPDFVLCQGEFCMAYHVVRLLKEHGVVVGAACSVRRVQERAGEDCTEKTVFYQFVRYREY
ncbi:MAG: hypothetical protein Q4F41_04810 [Eubacteriales bacterium]|nr:hypothetical protein [Eubacteriales bacterium]